MKFNEKYEKSNEQHLRTRYVYVKASDVYAYKDSTYTEKITSSELIKAFELGVCVIVDNNVYHKPISISTTSGVSTINYIKPNSTTATSADIASIYSKEYTAD